jgi:hypothetical protein
MVMNLKYSKNQWINMSDTWYMKENDGNWIKLKYRGDLSCLSDVFEFMERRRRGATITMDYGCMGTLIERGELIQEDGLTLKQLLKMKN